MLVAALLTGLGTAWAQTITLEDVSLGSLPDEFVPAQTGEGQQGRWGVVAYDTAVGGKVLAQPSTYAITSEPALRLERKIPLGDVRGRIDHLAIDLAHHHLFVAELGNNSVGVLDIVHDKLLHRIVGLKEPQGVGYDPATDAVYVANAGDGSVHRYRGSDFSPVGTLKLGDDADNIRVDHRTRQVVVGYGDGALALLDGESANKAGEIRLTAHPESFQLEQAGSRIFVNVPDARQVAVVDRASGRQLATWTLSDAEANFPMALDEAGERLLVVYRKPPLLAAFDTRTGAVVARVPTCGDADDVFFDVKRQRIYISCGEGTLAVIERQNDTYRELARIPTVPGARTALFVPDLDRLFLAVRARDGEPAGVWVYRPAP